MPDWNTCTWDGRSGLDEESLYKQHSCNPPLYLGFLMYRHVKKSVAGYVQMPRQYSQPRVALVLRIQGDHALLILLPARSPSPSSSIKSSRLHITSLPRSMVSTSIAPVSNKLESTNHLANGEESQALGRNNTSGYYLLTVDVSELLEHASG